MTPSEARRGRVDRRRAQAHNRAALHAYARLGITPKVVEYRDWGNLNRKIPGEQLLPKRWPAECGTEAGYAKHLRKGQQPCEACRWVHNLNEQERKAAA